MQVALVSVGKLKSGADRDLFDRYWSRLSATGKSVGLAKLKLVELPESKAATADARKADEGRRVLKSFGADAHLVVLDETGSLMTSETFAQDLRTRTLAGLSELVFAIGGADGHGDEVRARANSLLSLGRMTLPHGLARVVLAEQLYRAATILTGHPYHRSG